MKIEIVTVTPEVAKELLALNIGNFRRPDKSRIAHYAKAIIDDKWELTGDSIKITDNILIDGQHRLLAVIEAGKPIQTAIAWDVAQTGKHLDRGKPRTIGQWLQHSGHKDANSVAAIARLAIMHDHKAWKLTSFSIRSHTDDEVIDYANAYKNEIYSAIKVTRGTRWLLPSAISGAIAHLGSNKSIITDDMLTFWFWSRISEPSDVSVGDPVFALRERLVKSKAQATQKLSLLHVRWLSTIAWNKTVRGESARILRVTMTGPTKMEPPNIVLPETEYNS